MISLPATSTDLSNLLRRRRTRREFSHKIISLQALSAILFAAQGKSGDGRTVPSAGALYPLTLFALIRRGAALEPGLYQYISESHALCLHRPGNFDEAIEHSVYGSPPWIQDAATMIFIAATFQDMLSRFADQEPLGRRGERYIYLEAGAALQSMYLAATERNLSGVLLSGFDDARLNEALNLPAPLSVVAAFCVGPGKTE